MVSQTIEIRMPVSTVLFADLPKNELVQLLGEQAYEAAQRAVAETLSDGA